MRSFLKYTLASIVGFLVVIFVSFLILMGIASAIVSSSEKEVSIKDNSVLKISLNQTIVDRAPNDPFQGIDLPLFASSKKLGLDQIISAIDKASKEDKIKGIYLRLDNVSAGFSACEEIRNALVKFKSSGKFIYAYYTQKAYYLASVADKVFINPEGMLNFSGISANATYYKNALDKLGIEIQVIRHGKFKAAVEPFLFDKMTPENRDQITTYIGSIWDNVIKGISASRNIPVEKLNQIADENMSFRPAKASLENRLVDSIMYEDQVLDFLRSKTGIKPNKDIPAVSISDMKNVVEKHDSRD